MTRGHDRQATEQENPPDLVIALIRPNTERPKPLTPLLAETDDLSVSPCHQEADLARTIAKVFQQVIRCVTIPIPAKILDDERHYVRQIGGRHRADGNPIL